MMKKQSTKIQLTQYTSKQNRRKYFTSEQTHSQLNTDASQCQINRYEHVQT